jgi:UDPglucose 6-dehydrogenase
MNIGIIGTGYVGLVQGVTLSEFGLNVTCMDVSDEKINMLKRGESPIYEPGLQEVLQKNIKLNRLMFTSDINEVVQKSEVIFIAVGTPSNGDGSTDLQYVLQAVKNIATTMDSYKVIVTKSTVPVGTGKRIKSIVNDILKEREVDCGFDIVSNPEFLREGKAMRDCSNPDRIIIGTEPDSIKAKKIMGDIYGLFNINQPPIVYTNIETAEMIKYASNAFLAVKISYINEIALLSEKVGADVQEVARTMGMDGRISPKFLHAGPGYGGSCFPKDTRAIVDIAKQYNEEMKVIQAAISANEKQKRKMVEKIISVMGNNGRMENKIIGVLGLSFKPETGDMREAPSIDIIMGLVQAGAKIQAYCPQGMTEAQWRLKNIEKNIKYMENEYEVSKEADAIVLITEWAQFRGLDLDRIKRNMSDNYFFDLRNIYAKRKEEMKKLFKYNAIGI